MRTECVSSVLVDVLIFPTASPVNRQDYDKGEIQRLLNSSIRLKATVCKVFRRFLEASIGVDKVAL